MNATDDSPWPGLSPAFQSVAAVSVADEVNWLIESGQPAYVALIRLTGSLPGPPVLALFGTIRRPAASRAR